MKKALILIQALLMFVIAICGVCIFRYYRSTSQDRNKYEELRGLVRELSDAGERYDGYIEDARVLDSYAELAKQNNDMYAWIKIPDTAVDYPVVRHTDNEYYLHRNFSGAYSYSGIPFADYQSEEQSLNTIIYAHNMKNGTMFAPIADYENKDFYSQHKRISYDTMNERGTYQILAAFSTEVGAPDEFKYYNYADIRTENDYREYVEKVKALSFYDTDVDARFGEPLLTLSTCAYHTSNERLVVVAKKIK